MWPDRRRGAAAHPVVGRTTGRDRLRAAAYRSAIRRAYPLTLSQDPAARLGHAHCHQKALWGTKDDVQLMRKAGVELLMPDTGCCGMAGSFGYRPEFYETSKRIASLALLPALEAAPDAALLARA